MADRRIRTSNLDSLFVLNNPPPPSLTFAIYEILTVLLCNMPSLCVMSKIKKGTRKENCVYWIEHFAFEKFSDKKKLEKCPRQQER